MSKIKILLAEDEMALGMIIQESLESREFQVTLCSDGNQAWESYQKSKPDVLVLDVMMPKKDGFTLAEQIRKTDPYTPIISSLPNRKQKMCSRDLVWAPMIMCANLSVWRN